MLYTSDSQNGQPYETKLFDAIRLLNKGLEGDANAVREAYRAFEQLRKDHPGRPIADAYHGSVMTLLARDETKPEERFQWVMGGLKLLDEAVAAAPTDRTIRMIRGRVAYKLPEPYFGRTKTAIEDYSFLLDSEKRNPGTLDRTTCTQLAFELAEALRKVGRTNEAEHYLKMAAGNSSEEMNKGEGKKKKEKSKKEEPVRPPLALAPTVQEPEFRDWLGAAICLTGASLLRWARSRQKPS